MRGKGIFTALAAAAVMQSAPGCVVEDDEPELAASYQEIVGGEGTGLFPEVPLLYAEFPDGRGTVCSGTVIGPRIVLTAAHCLDLFDPSKHVAYFGSDATDANDPYLIGSINITHSVIHPDYNPTNPTAGNDIALAFLESDAPVAPMPLMRSPVAVGSPTLLVGWGQTDGVHGDSGKKRMVMSEVTDLTSFHVSYGGPAANACRGDSGGPNLVNIGGINHVAGVSSFGDADCTDYGAATRVDVYADNFLDPYLDSEAPECLPDGVCNRDCAEDFDCTGESAALIGGCSTSGGQPPLGGFLLVLGALLAVTGRRR